MQFMVVLAFSTRFNLELFVVAGTKTRQEMPDVRRVLVLSTVHHCVPTIYLHHLYCVLKEPQDHLSRLVLAAIHATPMFLFYHQNCYYIL